MLFKITKNIVLILYLISGRYLYHWKHDRRRRPGIKKAGGTHIYFICVSSGKKDFRRQFTMEVKKL